MRDGIPASRTRGENNLKRTFQPSIGKKIIRQGDAAPIGSGKQISHGKNGGTWCHRRLEARSIKLSQRVSDRPLKMPPKEVLQRTGVPETAVTQGAGPERMQGYGVQNTARLTRSLAAASSPTRAARTCWAGQALGWPGKALLTPFPQDTESARL